MGQGLVNYNLSPGLLAVVESSRLEEQFGSQEMNCPEMRALLSHMNLHGLQGDFRFIAIEILG